MYDVIIAGAGPAGSLCAGQLAQKGHDVLVLEAGDSPGGKYSCTGLIGLECASKFSIDDRLILRKTGSARVFSPAGQSLHIYREEAQACVIDRHAFDIALAERAVNAGAGLRCGCRVTGMSAGQNDVRVTFVSHGNTIQENARYAVIACGYAPLITEQAGLGRPADCVAGAQVTVDAGSIDEVQIYLGDISPGFFAWIVPAEEGKVRTGLLARDNIKERMARWLDSTVLQGIISHDEQPAIHYGMIPLAPLPKTCTDRIVAVGDAAGQVKPLSGGGIYYGMLGVEAAAATLDEALNDQRGGTLNQYERRWKSVFGQEIRNGRRVRRFYEKLGSRWLERLFTAAQRSGVEAVVEKAPGVTFDWHTKTLKKVLVYQNFMVPRRFIPAALRREHIDRPATLRIK